MDTQASTAPRFVRWAVVAVGALMLLVLAGWMLREQLQEARREKHDARKVDGVADVQRMVLSNVAHPESASFRDIAYFPQSGAGCGYVDLKTVTGASTGYRRFVVPKDGDIRYEPEAGSAEISDFTNFEKKMCR